MNSLFLLLKGTLLGVNKTTRVFIILFMIALLNFLYPLYFLRTNIPDSSIAFWDLIGKTF